MLSCYHVFTFSISLVAGLYPSGGSGNTPNSTGFLEDTGEKVPRSIMSHLTTLILVLLRPVLACT